MDVGGRLPFSVSGFAMKLIFHNSGFFFHQFLCRNYRERRHPAGVLEVEL
jgi:hypothetical protein